MDFRLTLQSSYTHKSSTMSCTLYDQSFLPCNVFSNLMCSSTTLFLSANSSLHAVQNSFLVDTVNDLSGTSLTCCSSDEQASGHFHAEAGYVAFHHVKPKF